MERKHKQTWNWQDIEIPVNLAQHKYTCSYDYKDYLLIRLQITIKFFPTLIRVTPVLFIWPWHSCDSMPYVAKLIALVCIGGISSGSSFKFPNVFRFPRVNYEWTIIFEISVCTGLNLVPCADKLGCRSWPIIFIALSPQHLIKLNCRKAVPKHALAH